MGEHLPQSELRNILNEAAELVVIGATYRHYKGDEYKVVTIALREEDEQPLVVYQAEYGEAISFARSLDSWLEEVEWQGNRIKRFTRTQ